MLSFKSLSFFLGLSLITIGIFCQIVFHIKSFSALRIHQGYSIRDIIDGSQQQFRPIRIWARIAVYSLLTGLLIVILMSQGD